MFIIAQVFGVLVIIANEKEKRYYIYVCTC